MAAASSSSSYSLLRWNYDVFLSFRGEDTRKNFVDHLYMALHRGGIYTFKDDKKLEKGKSISSELLKAIKESRMAIIIFSKDYASSSWCLDELVEIIECKRTMRQIVWPIFYNVDPSDVRKQKGSFGEAFAKHEETFGEDKEKVQRWRTTLVEAANLSGWDLNNIANGHEAKFIKTIVQETLKQLGRYVLLNIAKYQVGIETRVNKVIALLDNGLEDVKIVGICGNGGIGKTTIAKAVFNQMFDQFESRCFLNVKKVSELHGVTYLQQQLLNNLLMEDDLKICHVDYGINMIKERLCHKKVLIVLDDVDSLKELEILVGANDWFGLGSKIIVTTRNERLLIENKVDHAIYRVELLNEDESFQLFSCHAFTKNNPEENYLKISWSVINYAQGLPLALEVLGTLLYKKSVEEWEINLDKLERIPNRKIQDVLRLSFDGLDDMDQKNIFLDIACFFNGWGEEYVMDLLESCGFYPRIEIPILIERSLLTITDDRILSMHNVIQEMGREIVREEFPDDPGKRSRLWSLKDINEVLRENTATEAIKGIMLNMTHDHLSEELLVNADVFAKMKKLRLLKLSGPVRICGQLTYLSNELRYLVWGGYPLGFLPSNFHPQNLVELQLPSSPIKQISTAISSSKKLKLLRLRHCPYLKETPDLYSLPCLEYLDLTECVNLVKVHLSSGVHKRLVALFLTGCIKLRSLPRSIELKNLEYFDLSECLKLEKFPEIQGDMDHLEYLNLQNTGIKDLDPRGCQNLKNVPDNIFCRMKRLKYLYMKGVAMTQLPSSIVHLSNLKILRFSHSFLGKRKRGNSTYLQLEMLSGLCSVTYLQLKNCNLSEESFPNDMSSLSFLTYLDVSENNFVHIPASFIQLRKLGWINLEHCRSLRTLTSLPPSVRYVNAHGCKSLERYWINPSSERSPDNWRLIFSGCHKLVMAERNNMPSISPESLPQENFGIVYPATGIPHWFNHKIEEEVRFEEGSGFQRRKYIGDHYNNVKGIAFFGDVLEFSESHISTSMVISLSINGYFLPYLVFPSESLSNQAIFTHFTEYYDGDEKAFRPIINLMNKKPKLSAGPPNICDDSCYIEATIYFAHGKLKKWGIHIVMESDQAETSNQAPKRIISNLRKVK
ncbi:disease resistance protein RUN1-like [Cornus florida]|uniref:disease resistance protein RUN1-like n=1 Tax=Cornus florida TaxID=4283 RepID=UPI00289F0557|nr:disease resistance protein RUN1-like [Cornus florida]